MIAEWDRKLPGRSWNVFGALSRVVPTHLMDSRLFDFAGLKPTGQADENGDIAFDTEEFTDPGLGFLDSGTDVDAEATNDETGDDKITPTSETDPKEYASKRKIVYMTDLRSTP